MYKRIGKLKSRDGIWALLSVDVSSDDMIVRLTLRNPSGSIIRDVVDTDFSPIEHHNVGDIVMLNDSDGETEYEIIEYDTDENFEYRYRMRPYNRRELVASHSALIKAA